ncbi:MAG: rubrerythrin family protein, partial [Spirochaetales bacterium]
FTRIAYLFGAVGEIEKEHDERYQKLLENLKNGAVFEDGDKVYWICKNCGHIHYAEKAPGKCPVCDHAQGYFERRAQNY